MTWAMRQRPVSLPRSSNRKSGFPASGSPTGFMSYARASALAHHPLGKLVLLGVISLFLWHGAERIYLTLRDMHAGGKLVLMWICYGSAGALTCVTIAALLAIGW